MITVNKVILVGNVGNTPDMIITNDVVQVAEFYLATTTSGTFDAWHRVILRGHLAPVADGISQGDQVYIEGRLHYGTYEKDGVTVKIAEIHAHEIMLVSGSLVPLPPGYSRPPLGDTHHHKE